MKYLTKEEQKERDREIFRIWKDNPNNSYYRISKMTGWSESTIKRAIDAGFKKEQQQKGINTHPLIEDALDNLRTAINETYERK